MCQSSTPRGETEPSGSDPPSITQAKAERRSRALRARSALSPKTVRDASAAICQRLYDELHHLDCDSGVAVYAAMSAEVDLDPLARRLLAEGVPVGYPRVDTGAAGRSMTFHLVTAPPTVPRGRPAIREPDGQAPVIANPAVIVLPGLAYDRDGGRLGYGGGFYDRYLATVPEAVRLGVCLDELVVDQVPRERHDMGIHSVVTETSVYRCRDAHL